MNSTLKSQEEVVTFPAGAVIFETGERGDVMYRVKGGQVRIVKGTEALEIVEVGGLFGEMVLVDDSPRSATALALTDVDVEVINEYQFLFMVHETPTFATKVMRTMAHRLRVANESR